MVEVEVVGLLVGGRWIVGCSVTYFGGFGVVLRLVLKSIL